MRIKVNIGNVFNALKKRISRAIGIGLDKASNEAIEELKRYPPVRNYKRTFALREGWVKQSKGGIIRSTIIRNAVTYATYVQGANQSSIHRGHWSNTVANVAKDIEDRIVILIDREIDGR